jgi:ubiquinone/menaquinone biosynthesis C-methylase UbiE
LARHAGYAKDELAEIPDEAVSNSLGCGNPLAFSQVRPGDVVLDLGCGAGIDVALAAGKVGPTGRVIGVDMTDEMIAKARAVLAQAGLTHADIRKGIIEELPVETASVDWVISNCVINLSPEKPRVFAEIARVLKPGGRVMVSDILTDGLPGEVRQNLVLYSSCVAGAISEREYREGLERVGLADVRIRKRLDLDLAQFETLLESDRRIADAPDTAACANRDDTPALAAACIGNVWSAEISARKPA